MHHGSSQQFEATYISIKVESGLKRFDNIRFVLPVLPLCFRHRFGGDFLYGHTHRL